MVKEAVRSDIGNYYPFVQNIVNQSKFDLSLLSHEWSDLEQWRALAREKLHALLNYFPDDVGLRAETISVAERDGYREEDVKLQMSFGMETTAAVLIPHGSGPYPCVIALHDHGGFYYNGREKIIETDEVSEPLAHIRLELYEGRAWASSLARRGYVVIVIDAFYFGSRKLDFSTVSDALLEKLLYVRVEGMPEADYIRSCNEYQQKFEAVLVKHLLAAGATWPGILVHDDRRTIDYALLRPEVDPNRIGCCGLSLGAFRSVHLFGSDSRIKCAAAIGFLPSYGLQQFDGLKGHTYMVYTPGLYGHLDYPDIAGLSVPKPLLIQQCTRDELFPLESMKEAAHKLNAIYRKAGASDELTVTWHDVPHSFTIEMQEQAFLWMDRNL